jgi:hypothetical protein
MPVNDSCAPRRAIPNTLAGVQFGSEATVVSKLAFAICSAMLWFVAAAQAQGSQTGCSPAELNNLLQPSDPAYADAIKLAATLENHSFTIQCVLPSHFAQFLPRQTGAALFRTARGDFEALFRPKEQNFDDVFISEKRDENRSSGSNAVGYRYTLRDAQGHKLQDMAGREAFFVRHDNILFVTWQKNTAATLTESLGDKR